MSDVHTDAVVGSPAAAGRVYEASTVSPSSSRSASTASMISGRRTVNVVPTPCVLVTATEPDAAVAAGGGAVALTAYLEDDRHLVVAEADAGVLDLEHDRVADGPHGQRDRAGVGELERVPDQVPHDGLELHPIEYGAEAAERFARMEDDAGRDE